MENRASSWKGETFIYHPTSGLVAWEIGMGILAINAETCYLIRRFMTAEAGSAQLAAVRRLAQTI